MSVNEAKEFTEEMKSRIDDMYNEYRKYLPESLSIELKMITVLFGQLAVHAISIEDENEYFDKIEQMIDRLHNLHVPEYKKILKEYHEEYDNESEVKND